MNGEILDFVYKKTSKKANQIILVKENNFGFYIKENKNWKKILQTDCFYGKNGFSINRHSGDLTTPTGIYPILYAFGTEEKINTKIEYRKITNNSYFSDDESNIEEYNTWIESRTPIIGEHLIDYQKEYHYAMVIGFNINPKIKGMGSSIFIHCKGDKPYTAGCIAINEENIVYLLKKIKQEVYIIII